MRILSFMEIHCTEYMAHADESNLIKLDLINFRFIKSIFAMLFLSQIKICALRGMVSCLYNLELPKSRGFLQLFQFLVFSRLLNVLIFKIYFGGVV